MSARYRGTTSRPIGNHYCPPVADPCYEDPCADGGMNWDTILMVVMKLIMIAVLVVAVLTYLKSCDAREFSYNSEDWLFREGGPRALARDACLPYTTATTGGEAAEDATTVINAIGTLLGAAEHRDFCLPGELPETTCDKLAGLDFEDICDSEGLHPIVARACECYEPLPPVQI